MLLCVLASPGGGDDGVRTHDPLLAGQVLSQLSYTPITMGSLFQRSDPSDPRKLNNKSFRTVLPISSIDYGKFVKIYHGLHRKEVIQPHLPIRLPCYDLTPIIEPAFDSCLLAVSPLASGVFNFHGLTGGVYKARERIHRSMLICDY